MGPQTRVNDFQGTDREYIIYLESLVLEKHNASSTATFRAGVSPPSPPVSEAPDKRPISSDADTIGAKSYAFIPYNTNPANGLAVSATKRRKIKQRWQREMDDMMACRTAEQWRLERKKVGLSTAAEILTAFDMIISNRSKSISTARRTDEAELDNSLAASIVQLLNVFATETVNIEVNATFVTRVSAFRLFVFVSLCSVALHTGTDLPIVDKMMQICISDSSEKNLARLRKGALWVNRMMQTLSADGFGHLAYEYFVLWAQPIARYGRFADSGRRGFEYFRDNVPRHKPTAELHSSLPFWVPFIIKSISGELFSLESICTALHYDNDPRINKFSMYSYNYLNRLVPLPVSQESESISDFIGELHRCSTETDTLTTPQMESSSSNTATLAASQIESSIFPLLAGTDLGFFNDPWFVYDNHTDWTETFPSLN